MTALQPRTREAVLQIASVAMMAAAVALWIGGSRTLPDALMAVVVSFLVFSQVKLFGMGVSMLRLAGAAIDRTVETEQMPRLDEKQRFGRKLVVTALVIWGFSIVTHAAIEKRVVTTFFSNVAYRLDSDSVSGTL